MVIQFDDDSNLEIFMHNPARSNNMVPILVKRPNLKSTDTISVHFGQKKPHQPGHQPIELLLIVGDNPHLS